MPSEHRVIMQILLERREIWIAASEFDEFCKEKIEKVILFCTVFLHCLMHTFVNYSAKLDTIILDLSMTSCKLSSKFMN